MSGFKHIRDMRDLSNESDQRLHSLLLHWRFMAETSGQIGQKKRQREYEQKARRIERAIKLKQTRKKAL